MIKNEHLPHNITNNRIDITFCGKGKCKCPAISVDKNSDNIVIGGDDEGYTNVTKEIFKKFSDNVRSDKPTTLPGKIKIDTTEDKVIFSGDDGETEFTHEEFSLFLSEIQNGTFDSLIS
tara:strand:- start:47 stop:403 length:357 start_codon:yes stop_codon:yes gene_type:complete